MYIMKPDPVIKVAESNSISVNGSIVPPDVMNSTESSQPCETTSNFQSAIVLTDSPIVAPDVVIPIKCSQPGERTKRNQQLGALQSNGAEYGKQYKKDRLYSKTNNIRSTVKISECSFRPKYNIPLLIGSNFILSLRELKMMSVSLNMEKVLQVNLRSFLGGFLSPTGTNA